MKDKYKMLVNDTLIFAVGSFGSKLILFLLVPLYTNYLSAEEYGISDLVFTFSQFLIPIFSVCIYQSILRFGLSKNEKKEDVLFGGIIVLAIGAVVCILFTPLLECYSAISPWKWYLSIYVIIYMLNSVILNYIKVLGRNKFYVCISIMQTFILALSNIIFLVFMKVGISGYLLSNITACCGAVLVGFFGGGIYKALSLARFNKALIILMIKFSAPIIINDLAWWLIHSTDKVMIEAMVGVSALGIYTVATKVPALINVIIAIFSQAWGISTIVENETTNDKDFYANVFRIYSFIAFGATIVLTAIIKPFMGLYVGKEFYEAWKFVPLLLASASFSAISSFYGALYGAFKKNVSSMTTTLIAAVINIVVNYICIIFIGIWGAIIGTVMAYLSISTIRMVDTRRFLKFDVNPKLYVINGMIVLIQTILVALELSAYAASFAAIIAFVLMNRNTLSQGIIMFRKILKRR